MIIGQNEEVNGFGASAAADLAELRKALSVGYSREGNDSIRVESLEASLKLTSYGAQHVKIWNAIAKVDEFSTVSEFNQLTDYGQDAGGFVPAGWLPEEEDSTYVRQTAQVKYVGTTRSVAHPTTLIRTVPADIIGQETTNGILWMLRKIERGLIYGDSDAVPLEWDGIMKQIIEGGGIVIDLRGGVLSDAKIEEASDLVAQAYGTVTQLFAQSTVFSDFSRAYYDKQRFNRPGANETGRVGTPVKGMTTMNGDVDFNSDIFITRGAPPVASPTSPKAPPAPTFTPTNPGATTGSEFVTADNGTYKYQMTGVNQYGESAPTAISAGVALVAGEAASLAITDGGGAYPATAYRIYRTEKGGATTYFMKLTPRATSAGAYISATTYVDLNADLPRTTVGLLLDMSDQSIAFKQLSPLIKMPLAQIAPAIRWMQLLYGTPVVYAPKRNVVFKNIGKL